MPKIESTVTSPNQHTANGNIIGMNMIITPIKAIVPKPSASPTLQVIMINIYNISLLELRLSNYLIRYPMIHCSLFLSDMLPNNINPPKPPIIRHIAGKVVFANAPYGSIR